MRFLEVVGGNLLSSSSEEQKSFRGTENVKSMGHVEYALWTVF